jgi:hypothetical protein
MEPKFTLPCFHKLATGTHRDLNWIFPRYERVPYEIILMHNNSESEHGYFSQGFDKVEKKN